MYNNKKAQKELAGLQKELFGFKEYLKVQMHDKKLKNYYMDFRDWYGLLPANPNVYNPEDWTQVNTPVYEILYELRDCIKKHDLGNYLINLIENTMEYLLQPDEIENLNPGKEYITKI